MAKRHKIAELERTRGNIDIPKLVNELGGQKQAASALGLSQASISRWLKINGYIPQTIYIKKASKS